MSKASNQKNVSAVMGCEFMIPGIGVIESHTASGRENITSEKMKHIRFQQGEKAHG